MPRSPVVEKKIAEIGPEDYFVKVTGTVTKKGESDLTIRDEEGNEIVVFADEPELFSDIQEGKTIRIYGNPLLEKNRKELRAEIIQDITGMDLKLYKVAKEELKKIREVYKT